MWIVIGAVIAAVLLFVIFRILSASRPAIPSQTAAYYDPDPDPVMMAPNPIADIGTAIATEVVADTVIGAVMDVFDSGSMDMGGDPGFDPGSGGSGFGDGSF